MNLPTYAEKILDPENADYLQLMPVKERKKKEKEQNTLDEEDYIDDDESTPGDLTHEKMIEDPWKAVKRYTLDMRDLVPLMKVNCKITVKKVGMRGQRPTK
jgi:hypothetical protein